MAEQEQDRTEPATPFKQQEAKKRGQVVKSLELNSFLVILGFLAVLILWGKNIIVQQIKMDQLIFDQAHLMDFEVVHLFAWFKAISTQMLYALSPLLLLLMIVAVAANMIQTGPIFTFFPLKPDFQRINPVMGLKRLFSLKLLFEAFKNIVKLIFFGAVFYFAIGNLLPRMLGLIYVHPDGYPVVLLQYVAELIFKLALAILVIVILDLAYTRWDYSNKLKMSRRELKEEVKRREGDPHIRARMRELQREAAKRGKALKRVPDADVLITNPHHLAVALLYQRDRMLAPQVIAKGANALAEQMKAIARRHRVPIVENKELARSLFKQAALDGPIPELHYAAIARLLAWVYRRRNAPLNKGAPA
ncbi:MAG TPA: flagellar biosynthesis protein FlhB [Acidiferrobacterales bacterium]|nr:flagellar biosynthesis protein FlhB [Acidiferrobacterales bacterium]